MLEHEESKNASKEKIQRIKIRTLINFGFDRTYITSLIQYWYVCECGRKRKYKNNGTAFVKCKCGKQMKLSNKSSYSEELDKLYRQVIHINKQLRDTYRYEDKINKREQRHTSLVSNHDKSQLDDFNNVGYKYSPEKIYFKKYNQQQVINMTDDIWSNLLTVRQQMIISDISENIRIAFCTKKCPRYHECGQEEFAIKSGYYECKKYYMKERLNFHIVTARKFKITNAAISKMLNNVRRKIIKKRPGYLNLIENILQKRVNI